MYKHRYILLVYCCVFFYPVYTYGQACTHYASPTGTGDGLSQSTPFLINNFWGVSSLPGKTLCLLNGTYTGSNSMITPPSGIAGTSGNPITIRALNPGQVMLDAQGANSAVLLSLSNGNNWFVIADIDAKNAIQATFKLAASNSILRRAICTSDAGSAQNNACFHIAGTTNIAEDCAGWGTNIRTIFDGSQGGDVNGSGFRRCWGEWVGVPGGEVSASQTYQIGNGTTDQIFENVLGTWSRTGVSTSETDRVAQVFFDGGGVPPFNMNGTKILGSIFYSLAGSTLDPEWGFQADEVTNLYMEDVVAFVDSTRTNQSPFYMYDCPSATCASNVCQNCLSVHAGTPLFNDATSGFTFPSLHQGNGLAAATGGTSAFTLLPGICTRYVAGTLGSTPLWPWPMDARILARRVAGGYRNITVTAEIESILGTIPTACRSSADSTPPTVSITAPANGAIIAGTSVAVTADASDDISVFGVQFKLDGNNLGAEDTTSTYGITWDTTTTTNGPHVLTAVARDVATNSTTSTTVNVIVANNPTNVSITANATITFLGNPTSVSTTQNAETPTLTDPTGLSITAAGTPTFLANPTGTSISASGTPTFLSNPTGISIVIQP